VTRDGDGGSSLDAIPRCGLVAYDGREPAVRALDLAIRWSRAVDGEVRLLVAGDEASDTVLETGGRVLHDHGIAWEGARLDADPADAVVEAIERWETDAVFMGAYGRGRLRDFVLGSHTEAILGAVGLPVFLTR
jgi:nucleotide-binding universal stress UspA family protein